MKPVRTSNTKCGEYVMRRVEFDGHQLYSRYLQPDIYVVYSYGPHWPLYANIRGVWYRNTEKVSLSTTRQSGYARPADDVLDVDCEGMKSTIAAAFRAAA